MAITQISQIKHRRGVSENLPQLASAELGWSVDTRKLYIGNGTLAEGAPEVGNTEILTNISVISGIPVRVEQTLTDNSTTANTSALANLVITSDAPGVYMNYTVDRAGNVQSGSFRIAFSQTANAVAYTDSNVRTSDIGVGFTARTVANAAQARIYYTTTSTGVDANLVYTITSL